MDVRIQALEAPSSTSDPRSTTYFQGNNRPDIFPSAVDDVSYAPLPTVMAPRRTLATAVPAAPAGVPFIPPAAAISPQLRASILAGNNINLAKILLCSETSDNRIIDCGDISVLLKDSDPRLTKSLTIAEFNTAFGVYRDTICEINPERRKELDTYLSIISDLAMSYGGTLFYEYHKSFSAKAAMYIQRFNQRLDWSVVDLALISRHFTGHRPLSCTVCGSFTHTTTSFCPKAASSFQPAVPKVKHERSKEIKVKTALQTPLCYKFNENFCAFRNCKFIHACSYCGDGHPKSVCPRRMRLVNKKK